MSAIVHLPGDLAIAIRELRDSDRPYILSSWARHVCHWLEHQVDGVTVRPSVVNRRCEKLLARHGALVASNPDDDRQMLGWACIDRRKHVAHFVFTLAPFRRNGVAQALCSSLAQPIVATHWSLDAEWLQARVQLRYCPSEAR